MTIASSEKVLVALNGVVLGYFYQNGYYNNSDKLEGYFDGSRLELISSSSNKAENHYAVVAGTKLVRGDGLAFDLIHTSPQYHFAEVEAIFDEVEVIC